MHSKEPCTVNDKCWFFLWWENMKLSRNCTFDSTGKKKWYVDFKRQGWCLNTTKNLSLAVRNMCMSLSILYSKSTPINHQDYLCAQILQMLWNDLFQQTVTLKIFSYCPIYPSCDLTFWKRQEQKMCGVREW
jgi:hypothetical protein